MSAYREPYREPPRRWCYCHLQVRSTCSPMHDARRRGAVQRVRLIRTRDDEFDVVHAARTAIVKACGIDVETCEECPTCASMTTPALDSTDTGSKAALTLR